MQRLHVDDLVGHVLEQEGWVRLNIPAIAESEQTYQIGPSEFLTRQPGDVLHAARASTGAGADQRADRQTSRRVPRPWAVSSPTYVERENLCVGGKGCGTAVCTDDVDNRYAPMYLQAFVARALTSDHQVDFGLESGWSCAWIDDHRDAALLVRRKAAE